MMDLSGLSHCLVECLFDANDVEAQSFMIEILLTLLKSCDAGNRISAEDTARYKIFFAIN